MSATVATTQSQLKKYLRVFNNFLKYLHIYMVEAMGWILMERFDQWKDKLNNPDARNIVDIIVSSIIGAAAGLTSSSGF